MDKIIFCNIAWMKYYRGTTEDDKPSNGGSYINEYGDGAESCNFLPHNHNCYGYVSYSGKNLNLSRVENNNNSSDINVIEDVLVIWVANRKIVGWYEHAKMYRQTQEFYDDVLGENKTWWGYNFKASENDVYLLPVEWRKFSIPSAATSGTGKGMGQSNVWYADSDYARDQVVPKVIDYIDRMRDACHINFLTNEQVNEKAQYSHNFTNEKLIQRASKWIETGNYLEALNIYNLIQDRITTPQESCILKYLRGNMLQCLIFYDEALEMYKQFMFDYDQLSDDERSTPNYLPDIEISHLDCMWFMASIYMALKQYFQACTIYQQFFDLETDIEFRCSALWRLMYIFNDEKDWKYLREIIIEYDKLNTDIFAESIEYFRQSLKEATGEYIKHMVKYPEREEVFPKIFNFKGVKFTRIDEGETIDGNYKFEVDNNTKDYSSAIEVLCKKYHDNLNVKVAVGTKGLSYSVKGCFKLPFECDVSIVDVLLSDKIVTHSIFTECIQIYSLNDFNERNDETGGFKIDSADLEFYLVDYTNANEDVIKHNGMIMYNDDDLEK